MSKPQTKKPTSPKPPTLGVRVGLLESEQTKNAGMFEGLHRRFDEVKQRLDSVDFDEFQRTITTVKQLARKQPGVAAQITRLHAELRGLQSLRTSLEEQLAGINPDQKNPYLAQFSEQKLADITAKLELFDEFQTNLLNLSSDVGGLKAKVAAHDTHIEMLNEGQQSLSQRVGFMENLRIKLPWWPLVIGVAFGIVAYVMLLQYTFMNSMTQLDGTVLTEPNTTYNHWLWKLGLAIGVSATVAGGLYLLSLIFGAVGSKIQASRERDEMAHNDAPPIPVNDQPIQPIPVASDSHKRDGTAPTKVLVTSPGAAPGTR